MNRRKMSKSYAIALGIIFTITAIIPVISGTVGIELVIGESNENSENLPGTGNGIITFIDISSPEDGSEFLEPKPLQNLDIEIKVIDNQGNPVFDSWIHVYENNNPDFYWEGLTNQNGNAYCPIPNVNEDTQYRIEALLLIDDDIYEDEIYITIKNRYLNLFVDRNPVDEGSEFFCIVKDQDDEPVSLAFVEFNGVTKFTNLNGKTNNFIAPWIDKTKTFTIIASAPFRGYDDDSLNLLVVNYTDPLPQTVYGQIRNYSFFQLENVEVNVITNEQTYTVYTDINGEYSCTFIASSIGENVKIEVSFPDHQSQNFIKWMKGDISETLNVNFWIFKDSDNVGQQTQGQQSQGQQIQGQQQSNI